eukprot:6070463-Pleurochrysis_carterae.AAC.1
MKDAEGVKAKKTNVRRGDWASREGECEPRRAEERRGAEGQARTSSATAPFCVGETIGGALPDRQPGLI